METIRLKAFRSWLFVPDSSYRLVSSVEEISRIFFRVKGMIYSLYVYIGYKRVGDVIDNFELADSNCSIVGMLYGSLFFVIVLFHPVSNRYHFITFV